MIVVRLNAHVGGQRRSSRALHSRRSSSLLLLIAQMFLQSIYLSIYLPIYLCIYLLKVCPLRRNTFCIYIFVVYVFRVCHHLFCILYSVYIYIYIYTFVYMYIYHFMRIFLSCLMMILYVLELSVLGRPWGSLVGPWDVPGNAGGLLGLPCGSTWRP